MCQEVSHLKPTPLRRGTEGSRRETQTEEIHRHADKRRPGTRVQNFFYRGPDGGNRLYGIRHIFWS